MRPISLALALFAMPAAASDWTIAELDGTATLGAPTVSFADDAISGTTGCNSFNGAAQVDDGNLVLAPALATTRMACPGSDLALQEARLLELLSGTVTMQIDPFTGSLTLLGNGVSANLVPGLKTSEPNVGASAYVVVSGVDATLNVRSDATTKSAVVAHAPVGLVMRNLGCADRPDRTWCNVRYISDGAAEGWAAAEYLAPATATRRAGAELFDEIGRLDCGTVGRTDTAKCDFGLAREGDDTGAILVYLDNNRRMLLEYRGRAVSGIAGDTEASVSADPATGGYRVTAGVDEIVIPPEVVGLD